MAIAMKALSTDERFQLELAITDWRTAVEIQQDSMKHIARLLDCEEDEAIDLLNKHERAQAMFDELGIEVYASELALQNPATLAELKDICDPQSKTAAHKISADEAVRKAESQLVELSERSLTWIFFCGGVVMIAVALTLIVCSVGILK